MINPATGLDDGTGTGAPGDGSGGGMANWWLPLSSAFGGMANAFGQAAMPSRMKIPFGAALGMAGGGFSQGLNQGIEAQYNEARTQQQQMQNQLLQAQMPYQRAFANKMAQFWSMTPEQMRAAYPGWFPDQQGSGAPPGSAAAVAGTPQPGSMPSVLPRDTKQGAIGQQANNPGNLMYTPGVSFPGAEGVIQAADGRYVLKFQDTPTGVAAMSDNLSGYQLRNELPANTIRNAVNRWVGYDAKTNPVDTTAYVNAISKATGIGPDDVTDLTSPDFQKKFFLAQQPFESGKQWLTPGDVDTGLQFAASRRAQAARAATGGPQGQTVAPPAATVTPPQAPPGLQTGGVPPPPPGGAPGGPTGAPQGIGAALTARPSTAPPAPPPPPNPPAVGGGGGPAASAAMPPLASAANPYVASMVGGMLRARGMPAPPGTVMAAGPGAGQTQAPTPTVAPPAGGPPAGAEAPWPVNPNPATYDFGKGGVARPPPAAPAPPAQTTAPPPAQTTTAPPPAGGGQPGGGQDVRTMAANLNLQADMIEARARQQAAFKALPQPMQQAFIMNGGFVPQDEAMLRQQANNLRQQANTLLTSGPVAGAQEAARLQQQQIYQPTTAGLTKQAEAPYTFQSLRPGGVMMDGNGNVRGFAPIQSDEVITEGPNKGMHVSVFRNPMTGEVIGQSNPSATAQPVPNTVPGVQTGPNAAPPHQQLNVRPPGTFQTSSGIPAGALPKSLPPQTQEQLEAAGKVPGQQLEHDRTIVEGDLSHAIDNVMSSKLQLMQLRDANEAALPGFAGDLRAEIRNMVQTISPSLAASLDMDAAPAQVFKKVAQMGSGAAERGDLGARGGVRAIEMYQRAYPNLENQPQANHDMANALLVANQMHEDYARGAGAYYNMNYDNFTNPNGPHTYSPLSRYDAAWINTMRPELYKAAIQALNGKPSTEWNKGLSSQQRQIVGGILQRVDPNASVDVDGKQVPVSAFTKVVGPTDIFPGGADAGQ